MPDKSKKFLLGVDLGTSATKAGLYDSTGTLLSEGRAEVPLYYPQPDAVEQDMQDFYQSAAVAIRQCMDACTVDPAAVAGLAFDSQMAGIGAVDEDFRPAMRFDSWLDARCKPFIAEMERRCGARVTELTGCAPTLDHGPKMLWWAHERPADYARIAKFLTPSAYVAGRVVGLRADEAFMDTTFLHFTGVADAVAGTWSAELCDTLEIDARRLPRIVEPWTVVGELTPEAARDFGLAPGTPVAAGCGDTAAGALGAGVVRPGMLLDTAGTASVLACCTDRFVADIDHRALIVMRSVVPGVWNPLAYVGGGGLAVQWFGRSFAADGSKAGGADEFFAAVTDAPPACDGLLFSPHLGGRVCPAAPGMRGAWLGFSWGHTRKRLLPRDPRKHRLRVRVVPAHPARARAGTEPRRGAGDRRRRQERGLEPDQGRRPVGSLPEARAQGMRHVGERPGRRQGLRTDHGLGGGRNGLGSSGG